MAGRSFNRKQKCIWDKDRGFGLPGTLKSLYTNLVFLGWYRALKKRMLSEARIRHFWQWPFYSQKQGSAVSNRGDAFWSLDCLSLNPRFTTTCAFLGMLASLKTKDLVSKRKIIWEPNLWTGHRSK